MAPDGGDRRERGSRAYLEFEQDVRRIAARIEDVAQESGKPWDAATLPGLCRQGLCHVSG